jgi:hypothetical protein
MVLILLFPLSLLAPRSLGRVKWIWAVVAEAWMTRLQATAVTWAAAVAMAMA